MKDRNYKVEPMQVRNLTGSLHVNDPESPPTPPQILLRTPR